MFRSLLPPAATGYEKALERAVYRRGIIGKEVDEDLGVKTGLLISPLFWDYRKCPEKYLPYLAWSLRVDIWRDDWTVEEKREIIKKWLQIRARRGTRWAIEQALTALGISADIREWFEDGTLPRFWFGVDIFVDRQDVEISKELLDRIKKIVEMLKPLRARADFEIGVKVFQRPAMVLHSGACRVVKVIGVV